MLKVIFGIFIHIHGGGSVFIRFTIHMLLYLSVALLRKVMVWLFPLPYVVSQWQCSSYSVWLCLVAHLFWKIRSKIPVSNLACHSILFYLYINERAYWSLAVMIMLITMMIKVVRAICKQIILLKILVPFCSIVWWRKKTTLLLPNR